MTGRLLHFGDYAIDFGGRILRSRDGEVELEPKVFDCLAYLILHRHRAVSRDELIAAVWGQADVTDAMLGQAVLKARRVLGDNGKRQECIRTVHRFGYRWVASTDPAAKPSAAEVFDASNSASGSMPATSHRQAPRSYVVPASFGLAAAAFLMIWVVVIGV